MTPEQVATVWTPTVEGAEGTALAAIVSQLREAKTYYDELG